MKKKSITLMTDKELLNLLEDNLLKLKKADVVIRLLMANAITELKKRELKEKPFVGCDTCKSSKQLNIDSGGFCRCVHPKSIFNMLFVDKTTSCIHHSERSEK